MSERLTSVIAYRRDIADGKELRATEDEQGAWIMIGTILEHALPLHAADRPRAIAQAIDLVLEVSPGFCEPTANSDSPDGMTGHLALLDGYVDVIEEGGARELAAHMRAMLRSLRRPGEDVPLGMARASYPSNDLTDLIVAGHDHPESWEVDLLPLPIFFEDDPLVRPSLAIAMSGTQVAHMERVDDTPSSLEDVCSILLGSVMAGIESGRPKPEEITVRLPSIADFLRRSFEAQGAPIVVRQSRTLPRLDREADRLRAEDLPETDASLVYMSKPIRWAAWGHGHHMIAELFAAVARYRAAACDAVLGLGTVMWARTPRRTQWLVTADSGLALLETPLQPTANEMEAGAMVDIAALRMPDAPRHLLITFHELDDLHPETRAEIRRAQWALHDAHSYPRLSAHRTPGGGVTEADLQDLTDVANALPRFVARHAPELAAGGLPEKSLEWTDDATGVRFEYSGRLTEEALRRALDDLADRGDN
jgi:hypothetical protein